jgi:hypothetical protein
MQGTLALTILAKRRIVLTPAGPAHRKPHPIVRAFAELPLRVSTVDRL